MSKRLSIIRYILWFRDFVHSLGINPGLYKSGKCYEFSLHLIALFDGTQYYDSNHVITLIDDVFYDIDGEFELKEEGNYIPLTDTEDIMRLIKSSQEAKSAIIDTIKL